MRCKKMTVHNMYEAGIEYHAFQRVKNAEGVREYRFILSKPLTKQQAAIARQYKNTILSSATLRYAPEIKDNTIILTDKCLKKESPCISWN